MQSEEKDTTAASPQNDQSLENFLRLLVHELRNPLQALHLTLVLFERQLGPDRDPKVEQYLRRAERVQHEIEQILTAAGAYRRIRAQALSIEEIDLNLLIESIQAQIPWREGDRIVIEQRLPIVQSDSTLLRVIFENLIRNALQYNVQPERRVTVSARHNAENQHVLVFEDNGIGIDAAAVENLFQPYKRLAADYGEGAGMGLFLAQTAAERLGGTITVQSTPGAGSQFSLTLPKAA